MKEGSEKKEEVRDQCFVLILIENTFQGRRRGEPQERSAGRDPEGRIS